MHALFSLIGFIFGLACLGCTIVILIDAFKSAVWKGFASVLCCIYFVYFALAEFKHKNKILIVLGSFLGGGVSGLFYRMYN